MFNPHIKFETSTITCNKEMKGNAKCKNSRFEPHFEDLGVTHTVHLWLDGKRVVKSKIFTFGVAFHFFLLVLIEFFSISHGCCTIKLSEIGRNPRFPGVGHF